MNHDTPTEPETREKRVNTCGGCDNTWPSTAGQSFCHCSAPGCHVTLSGLSLFEAHRVADNGNGHCIPPAALKNQAGKRVAFFRDGMWRGEQMTAEQAAAIWKKDQR